MSLDHVIVMIMIVMPWIMIIINLQTFNYFLSLDHITIMIIIMTIWLMITITLQTFNYFLSLDMPVMELLGSSETGGPQTACLKVKTYSHKHLFIESEINNWKKIILQLFHQSLSLSQIYRVRACAKAVLANLIPTLRRQSLILIKSIDPYVHWHKNVDISP